MERILCIGDMHPGSIYGIATKEHIENMFQQWLYEEVWSNLIKTYQGNINKLQLLGDNVDGPGRKDSTSSWTTNVHIQVDCAVELLRPFVTDGVEVRGVSGSKYHTGGGTGFDGDRLITDFLGGQHNATARILKTSHGLIMFHHPSKNSNTELNNIRIQNGESDGDKTVLLVGAHLHRYEERQLGFVKVIHTPCFEFATDFMGPVGLPVQIGCVVLEIDENRINSIATIFPIPSEVRASMYDFEELHIKKIIEQRKRDNYNLSKLTGVSMSKIEIIRKIQEPKIILPAIQKIEEIQVKKEQEKKIQIPK